MNDSPYAKAGTHRVVLDVLITTEHDANRLEHWDWEDLVGIGTTFVRTESFTPPREWQPMTLPQIKAYLDGHVVPGVGRDDYETRETEHGVEYR